MGSEMCIRDSAETLADGARAAAPGRAFYAGAPVDDAAAARALLAAALGAPADAVPPWPLATAAADDGAAEVRRALSRSGGELLEKAIGLDRILYEALTSSSAPSPRAGGR